MKHLIKDNQIIMSGIPGNFTRDNDEGFWGGYDTRTDLHYEDGWRDEEIPIHNARTQYLGNPTYNSDLDIVTYEVLNLPVDLADQKLRLNHDLARLRTEISSAITQIKLLNDVEPPELTQMLPMIKGMYSIAKTEIELLTEEDVLEYTLRGPMVKQLMDSLYSLI